MQKVYFDNAATTLLRDEVIDAITEVMKNNFGNPSSSHGFGRASKSLVEKSRKSIAEHLNVTAAEIIFTSGGTEADNFIINSAVNDLSVTHIITSKIEHHAVLHTVEKLGRDKNINVSYVNLDAKGNIDFSHLERLVQTESKTLVSLMHINNEIGNILDLNRVSSLCQENNALFHTDAVQAVGHYHLDLGAIPVDFISASAHKFHGPKGIGFAFIRKNSGLQPMIVGGEQERGLRAGTENVPSIVGMETALNMAYKNLEAEKAYLKGLKQYFIEKSSAEIPNIAFNGNSANFETSSHTLLNVRLPLAEDKAAMLLFQLDLKGIACSRGSACQSGSSKKSHVLTEILNDTDLQKPSLRFSFSIFNTKEEVDYVIDVLKGMVNL
ncbi:cysteine desulfurase family protein [Tamlana sp. 2_MG-2023]|uniref:cysteine desulfurase family protein n=1 Tax=unclassified Tamlana TaxID=2614803 RepID=UPI0026E240FE|nr:MULTISPECIES: cysteine desulfurase family protein [unclassified Tamlana]MDO6761554.1 cysteine desulfurase family protein [Tamlana sp. 2_MG-2023]MDO6792316.1 cysteine desulfurase family protein [Tamlana sp. 1_MG-2023]